MPAWIIQIVKAVFEVAGAIIVELIREPPTRTKVELTDKDRLARRGARRVLQRSVVAREGR